MHRNQVPRPRKPLADVIDENHNLLTAIGIFVALTVFSASLPVKPFKPIGIVLSFCFLGEAIILSWEFYVKSYLPANQATVRLYFFQLILELALVILVLYWLLAFRELWRGFLIIPLAFMILGVMIPILQRLGPRLSPIFERVPNKWYWRVPVSIAWVLIIFYVAIRLASWATLPLNQWLDNLLHGLESMSK